MTGKRGCGRSGNRRRHQSRLPTARTRGREIQVQHLPASSGLGASGNNYISANFGSPTVAIPTAVNAGVDVSEASQLPWFVAGGQVLGGNRGYQDPDVPSNQVQLPPTLVNTPVRYPSHGSYVGDGNGIDNTRVPTSGATATSTYVGHGSDPRSSPEGDLQPSRLTQPKALSTLEYCRKAHRNHRPRFHDADADADVDDLARRQNVVQQASRLLDPFNQGVDPYNGSGGCPGYYPSEITERTKDLVEPS